MAVAIAALLAEGESVERTAALCDTTEADVRRLRRLAAAGVPADSGGDAGTAGEAAPLVPAQSATLSGSEDEMPATAYATVGA